MDDYYFLISKRRDSFASLGRAGELGELHPPKEFLEFRKTIAALGKIQMYDHPSESLKSRGLRMAEETFCFKVSIHPESIDDLRETLAQGKEFLFLSCIPMLTLQGNIELIT